jgi:hypothetical protein
LREIVADIGADRGLLMAEEGFQPGAREAANLTNVLLTSLAELNVTVSTDISMMKIRDLQDRIDDCTARYWAIDQPTRIEFGLRADVGEPGYSGAQVCDAIRAFLADAARGKYAATTDPVIGLKISLLGLSAASPAEVIDVAEPIVSDLEARLALAERAIHDGAREAP